MERLNQGGRASDQAEIESGIIAGEIRTWRTRRPSTRRCSAGCQECRDKGGFGGGAAGGGKAREQQIQITGTEDGHRLVSEPDKAAAEARLQEAQSGANAASQRLAMGEVHSPMSGILYRLEVRARRISQSRRSRRAKSAG